MSETLRLKTIQLIEFYNQIIQYFFSKFVQICAYPISVRNVLQLL